MNKFIRRLRSIKKLDYLQRCIRRMNDENFVDVVLKYQRDYSVLKLKANTHYTNNAVVYHLEAANSTAGFCSTLRDTIDMLYFADCLGFVPVVEYDLSFQYTEKEGMFGTKNPFEYYFTQPTSLGINDIEVCKIVIQSERSHIELAEDIGKNEAYLTNDEYIMRASAIFHKYIHCRPEVENMILKDEETIFGDSDKVLGVHYRGTDFRNQYKDHPLLVTENEYIEAINKVMSTNEYQKIFIATDDSL